MYCNAVKTGIHEMPPTMDWFSLDLRARKMRGIKPLQYPLDSSNKKNMRIAQFLLKESNVIILLLACCFKVKL